MKNHLKKFFILIIISIMLLSLSGCDVNDDLKLNEKLKEELNYLDLEVISLINSINNITIENYKISTEEISLR